MPEMKRKDNINKIIQIMSMAGYDYIKEDPHDRLLFYDVNAEQEVQLWVAEMYSDTLERAIYLIQERARSTGISYGKNIVRNGIKKLLQL
jgi:hypothetical protein